MKIEVLKTQEGWKIVSSKYKTIRCKDEAELRHKLEVLDDLEREEKELQRLDRLARQRDID